MKFSCKSNYAQQRMFFLFESKCGSLCILLCNSYRVILYLYFPYNKKVKFIPNLDVAYGILCLLQLTLQHTCITYNIYDYTSFALLVISYENSSLWLISLGLLIVVHTILCIIYSFRESVSMYFDCSLNVSNRALSRSIYY